MDHLCVARFLLEGGCCHDEKNTSVGRKPIPDVLLRVSPEAVFMLIWPARFARLDPHLVAIGKSNYVPRLRINSRVAHQLLSRPSAALLRRRLGRRDREW